MLSNVLAFSNYDDNFSSINDIVYPHNKKYFDKHGIEYKVFHNNTVDLIHTNSKHITKCYYMKWLLLQDLLSSRNDVDYFFVIDTDIVICNFDLDVRIFTQLSTKDILLCAVNECSGDMFWNVNAGSLICKNTDSVKNFVSEYLDLAKQYDYNIIDQVLLQHLISKQEKYRSLFSIFPSNCFNHGGVDYFLYHDCSLSTSSSSLEQCIHHKSTNLQRAIQHLKEKGKIL